MKYTLMNKRESFVGIIRLSDKRKVGPERFAGSPHSEQHQQTALTITRLMIVPSFQSISKWRLHDLPRSIPNRVVNMPAASG